MSNIAPSRADPVVDFPLCRWCPPQETSQPHPPPESPWATFFSTVINYFQQHISEFHQHTLLIVINIFKKFHCQTLISHDISLHYMFCLINVDTRFRMLLSIDTQLSRTFILIFIISGTGNFFFKAWCYQTRICLSQNRTLGSSEFSQKVCITLCVP